MILTISDYREMASQVNFGINCEEYNMVEFEKEGIAMLVCCTAEIDYFENGEEVRVYIESVQAWDSETNEAVEVFFNTFAFEDEVREAA